MPFFLSSTRNTVDVQSGGSSPENTRQMQEENTAEEQYFSRDSTIVVSINIEGNIGNRREEITRNYTRDFSIRRDRVRELCTIFH